VEGVTTIRNRIEFIPVNCPRWRGVTVNHYAVGSNPTTGANSQGPRRCEAGGLSTPGRKLGDPP